MKLITKALSEKKLTAEQLPAELQTELTAFTEMINTYNAACDEYEKETDVNKETEAKLDENEEYLSKTEKELAEKITAYVPEVAPVVVKKEEKNEEKKEEKTEEKGSGAGLILGVIVLGLTLGLVNMLKKGK